MDAVLITVLNQSLTAVWLIAAVILIRVFAKKLPARYFCLLWGLVGLRLMAPLDIESIYSLVPTKAMVTPEILLAEKPQIDSGINAVNNSINPVLEKHLGNDLTASISDMQLLFAAAAFIWIIGMIVFAVTAAVSWYRLKKRVRNAEPLQKGIYRCSAVETPFILGFFRPNIYLPDGCLQIEAVIAHEKAHLARFDHVTKVLFYVVRAVHWFNPLVWVSFQMFCKDVERACDEKVISQMSLPERKEDSRALLSAACEKKSQTFCPLAFGEISVKERVQRILSFEKPRKAILAAAVLMIACVCVFFMTAPAGYGKTYDENLENAVSQALKNSQSPDGGTEFSAEGHDIWGVERDGDITKVYANTSTGAYGFFSDKFIEKSGSGAIPAVLYFKDGEKYTFDRIRFPEDGDDYEASVKEMFPGLLTAKALWIDNYGKLKRQKEKQAEAYLKEIGRTAQVGSYNDFQFTLWSEGISSDIANELAERYPAYPIYIGTEEVVRNGERHVYESNVEHVYASEADASSKVIFTHYLYDEQVLFERIIVTIQDGKYTESIACGRGKAG